MRRDVRAPRALTGEALDREYHYWRMRTLIVSYIGYATFYITRKSFTFAIPEMVKALSYSPKQLGLLSSAFYVVYGVSKFLSGMLSDRSNPRYFMAFGLLMTALVNLGFGLSHSLTWLMIFWVLNGFFQGWGWPPASKLLTHWFTRKERGVWWSLWNTSHNFGGAIAPKIATWSFHLFGVWPAMLFMPAGIAAVVAVLVVTFLRDTPESQGLPPVEEYRHEVSAAQIRQQLSEAKSVSTYQIFKKYVLHNRAIWLLALAYIMLYIVRTTFNDWGVYYLTEHGCTSAQAQTCIVFFEVGGFLGGIAAGWCSDRIFSGRRGETNLLFSASMVLAVALFGLERWVNFGFMSYAILMALLGFVVFGPQMLIGVTAAELSHREAAGTSTGFIGLFAYLGAAMTGYPVGKLIEFCVARQDWQFFVITMLICSFSTCAALWPLRRVVARSIG